MANSYWESFKEKNKDNWHFDPSIDSQDYTFIGRLKIDFKPLLDLMSDDSNFKEHIIVNNIEEHKDELNERIEAFREWGYNEHNTSSLQITDADFPDILKPYKEFAGFGECKAVALKQYPGQFLPWHQDTYVGFKKEFNVPDDVKVTRYSLFLEDWNWGHYFAVGNNVIHQWKQGDFLELKPRMHHVTCNAGITPKLSMTITGTITEEFLRRQKTKNFEIN